MTAVFADTAYFVAAVNPRDAHAAAARSFVETFVGRLVTTEFVLLEVANFLARGPGRAAFVDLVNDLTADPLTEVVPASSELWRRGVELFAQRPDKEWSLTDCTSFVVMTDRSLIEALTSDRFSRRRGSARCWRRPNCRNDSPLRSGIPVRQRADASVGIWVDSAWHAFASKACSCWRSRDDCFARDAYWHHC